VSICNAFCIWLYCEYAFGCEYLQRVSVFGCVMSFCSAFLYGCVVKLIKMFSLFAGVFFYLHVFSSVASLSEKIQSWVCLWHVYFLIHVPFDEAVLIFFFFFFYSINIS